MSTDSERDQLRAILRVAEAFPGHVRIETPRERTRFIDRQIEHNALEAAWTSGRAELVMLHGRRRVGKSRLLTRFAERKPIAYYVAAQQLEADQLQDLGRSLGALSTGFSRGRPPRLAFSDWQELLDVVTEAAGRRRIGLILDEFPYLVAANPALPSLIQRWWDRTGSRSNVLLVLAGSEQTMMRQLVDRDGALHGRPTRRLQLTPLDYFQAGKFMRRWAPIDRIRAYAVAGGTPAYLERFDDRTPFRHALYWLAYSPDGRLFQEAEELLSREFTEPRTYETVLRAIANGRVTPSEIASQAGLHSASRVTPYLDRLISLGLVERRVLPLDHVAPRPRTSQYVLADPYLRFYFALVDPWRSAIQRGQGEAVLMEIWGQRFDAFVSRVFEDVGRQYIARLAGARQLPALSFVGPWWFDGGDVDVVGISGRHVVVAAETKWTEAFVKPADLAELQSNMIRLAGQDSPRLVLISRSGFDRNLRGSEATLVGLRDLFRPGLDYETHLPQPE